MCSVDATGGVGLNLKTKCGYRIFIRENWKINLISLRIPGRRQVKRRAVVGLSDGRKRCQQNVVFEFEVRTGIDEFWPVLIGPVPESLLSGDHVVSEFPLLWRRRVDLVSWWVILHPSGMSPPSSPLLKGQLPCPTTCSSRGCVWPHGSLPQPHRWTGHKGGLTLVGQRVLTCGPGLKGKAGQRRFFSQGFGIDS